LDFFVRLGLNFHPMGEFGGGGEGSIGLPTFICHGRTETWLLKSRLSRGGATNNNQKNVVGCVYTEPLSLCHVKKLLSKVIEKG